MKNIVVYYHAECPDGFGSAWSFYVKYGDTIEYIPYRYGDEIGGCKGKHIYFVDCSTDRETLLRINEESDSVTVLDHHISAFNKIGDLDFCHFNMNNSGCVLAWKYLFPNEEVLILLQYIQDRDLWSWKLDSAKEVLAIIDSYPKAINEWNYLNKILSSPSTFDIAVKSGSEILRYREMIINKLSKNYEEINILGHSGVMINSPVYQGEIADKFDNYEVILVYYKSKDNYRCSLRTRRDDIDVSKIAEKFGGGGHKKASGFVTLNMDNVKNVE